MRGIQRLCVTAWWAALGVLAPWSPVVGQSIPKERPPVRPASAIAEWADWEKTKEMWKRIPIPPSPALSPEQALKTFRLAPGYRIELVASEPMVEDPVFIEFDANGRLWAVEMRGYMRDLEGNGEGDPIGRIVVMEDTDGDGRMDQSTVFLDHLVMPRSIAFVEGGVLVVEPPNLWYCRDLDGDLRSDSKVKVGDYGQQGNPQHTANGLIHALDNWMYSADMPARHRFVNGQLTVEPFVHRGQWGMTQDDQGRLMYNYENSPLHADLIPAEYLFRNKHGLAASSLGVRLPDGSGVNVNIGYEAREVFPIRVTPGITLGARELRDDGTLRTYTIAAGPSVYRGHQFPEDAYGNVFIPEAAGNLVGRLKIGDGIAMKASRYYGENQEFLASTDERFRPVNSRVGPDGTLYIADFYQGIIEHAIFMVPYLRDQIISRGLDKPPGLGRIYRVVYEGKAVDRAKPRMSDEPSARLVDHLSHPNGWWRDTAQRLLVERRDQSVVPMLRQLAVASPSPLARLHALWTLEGLRGLDWPTLNANLDHPHERVRASAIRLCERLPGGPHVAEFLARLSGIASDPSEAVRLQAVLTLGQMGHEQAQALMVELVSRDDSDLLRVALMCGSEGRELELLTRLLRTPAWQADTPHHRRVIEGLAMLIMLESQPDRVARLLDHANVKDKAWAWQAESLRVGLLQLVRNGKPLIEPLKLEKEPSLFAAVAESTPPVVNQQVKAMSQLFHWPGDEKWHGDAVAVKPLTQAQKKLFDLGRERYLQTCVACHQPHGGGLPNVAPPLAGSQWVQGDSETLVRIALQGVYGPIEVADEKWNLAMPGQGANPLMDDQAIAGVLTYVRREWGNGGDPIEPEKVKEIREKTKDRFLPWTVAELTAVNREPQDLEQFPAIKPSEDGALVLSAKLAHTYGNVLRYHPELDIIGPWVSESDLAIWVIDSPQGGDYQVHLTWAMTDDSANNKFVIETAAGRLHGVIPSTGGFNRFDKQSFGTIRLAKGRTQLLMRSDGPIHQELADLREIALVPIRR